MASENVRTLILQERRDAGLPFRIILEQHAEHGNALGKFCQRDMAEIGLMRDIAQRTLAVLANDRRR